MASSVDFFCSFTQYRVLSLNVQLLFLARKHSLSPYWLIAILLFSKTGGGDQVSLIGLLSQSVGANSQSLLTTGSQMAQRHNFGIVAVAWHGSLFSVLMTMQVFESHLKMEICSKAFALFLQIGPLKGTISRKKDFSLTSKFIIKESRYKESTHTHNEN